MDRLKIAVQKKGRLSEKSLDLLRQCGIQIDNGKRGLMARASNFALEVLYLRDDDIPRYVERGTADIGIVGQNEIEEQQRAVSVIRKLGFGKCRLSIAVPRGQDYDDITDLNGRSIATSYPTILKDFLTASGVNCKIEYLSGSVEIAPSIGTADAICDLVSTGSTLLLNGLREVETIMLSEAAIIKQSNLDTSKQTILDQLLFRISAVQRSKQYKYIMLNSPDSQVEAISNLLPGMKSPTVMPLLDKGWSSMHTVIEESSFWQNIDKVKQLGAEGILVLPIEKMIL